MFQFTGFPLPRLFDSAGSDMALPMPGFPIRKSTDRRLLTPPRGLSQLITSFVGSWCQGIHHMLLLAWSGEFNPESPIQIDSPNLTNCKFGRLLMIQLDSSIHSWFTFSILFRWIWELLSQLSPCVFEIAVNFARRSFLLHITDYSQKNTKSRIS